MHQLILFFLMLEIELFFITYLVKICKFYTPSSRLKAKSEYLTLSKTHGRQME